MATETNKKIRKGIKLYIDYFENEFAEISDEELGILIRSLYQYDQFQKVDEVYSEKINNDILLKTLFKILIKNNDRAVAEWNRKRKYFEDKDKDKNKDKDKDKNDLFSEIGFSNKEVEDEFPEFEDIEDPFSAFVIDDN